MAEDLAGGAGELKATLRKLTTDENSTNERYERICCFDNHTPNRLVISEENVWIGSPGTWFPDHLDPIEVGSFMRVCSYVGDFPDPGLKYGRSYVDGPEDLPTTRKFVVAFHDLNDNARNKVYAESGPVGPGPVDWNEIEEKLDNSENEMTHVDSILGGRIWITHDRNHFDLPPIAYFSLNNV